MAPTLPSIARRLAWTLLAAALASSIAVSLAVWLAVRHEVDELLDDTLQGAAEAMRPHLAHEVPHGAGDGIVDRASNRYAWQVVEHGPDGQARVVQRSSRAPGSALSATPCAGFADRPGWRVFGTAIGRDGRMLYVAQSREEQIEATLEIVMQAALATLAIALLSHLWLRVRVAGELEPLQRLGARLRGHDLLAPGATLGAAERLELQPVHQAVDLLAAQLGRRLAQERAFSAHAAHALRTPLAGIDAQLAVALREAPETLQPRLQRVRAAAGRLQRVVAALLTLFRSGVELQRAPLRLDALLARLPVDGLVITVAPDAEVLADADLLAAALMNLLDNAVRHGAHEVQVRLAAPGIVEVADDGPGVDAERRAVLRQALESGEAGDRGASSGLGLVLAHLVARAHGGRLELPDSEHGFIARLNLNPGPISA
ncbi:MAG: HAMP domain-containing histidine kinase [Burkholderiaceae bacterium]|nr:HAMP domain-containing histidine kinase [Rhodoferax sp.]MCP5286859.1 HAMP domain-containing histidine kinase [Burkholderiaceae bacterium]